MNEKNLVQNSSRSSVEKRAINRKGQAKGTETKKQKKKMKETMQMLLNLQVPTEEAKEKLMQIGLSEEDATLQSAILYKQVSKAISGDNESAKFCRDTSGEFIGAEDKEEIENKAIVYIPAKNIAKSFIDVYRSILNREYIEYWLEGGRGSTKSSFAGEMIIELLENNPNMCAIVIRRYTNTLKDSVYAQLDWAVQELSDTYPWLSKEYKFKKSPLEAVKEETGQRIYFRGTDDPGKIKSIKPPKGMYIGVIWYEEFDQIQGMNAVRKINQSIVRGGEDFVQIYTYNTPVSKQHFVNKEKRIPKKTRLVHLSDYRAVPKEWLGQAFIDEAEYIKETSPKIYENEYLGLETGDGGNVFENIELREISDDEIYHFDRLYRGIDWGWYPDPFAYNNMHFDSARRTLYIFDELRCNKTSNEKTWEILKDKKKVTSNDLITADSAEKKSIGDYKDYGAYIRGAEKGPGSVEYSMKWLASLNKIIIDPNRCPNTAQEFSEYEYEKDKDGNVITGYPDKNNHHIDAVRYALEQIWKRRGQ